MPSRRPTEPIAPATIPGQPLDPKIPPDQQADTDEDREDAEVGTDENGNEMLSARPVTPDVTSDRGQATNAPHDGAVARRGAPPLPIQEIENLEDDAKGG